MEIIILIIFVIAILAFTKKEKKDINNKSKKIKIEDTFIININNEDNNEVEKDIINKDNVSIKWLFTQYERQFYYYLRKEIQQDVNIFSKIRLIDFIGIKNSLTYWEKNSIINKINRKHIDFVLLDNNWYIICWIELDWKSHYTDKKTIENDKFKNYLFDELWIKLFRYKVWKNWDFSEIIEYINSSNYQKNIPK